MTSQPLSVVAERVRKHDPDRFLACLFAPPARREILLLLCAFNHELARAREVTSQPLLALIRLQWWREVVEGARRRHEVAGPLGTAIDNSQLPARDLLLMIEAREAEADALADRAAWLDYLAGTAGGLAVAAGHALGADAAESAKLRALGTAYGVAGQLGNVTALARQERCLLPLDVLAAHGLTPDHVIRDPSTAAPALAELAEEGCILLRAGQGPLRRDIVAAALPAVLARRDLARFRRPGRPVPTSPRGLGDKLAVALAASLGRI